LQKGGVEFAANHDRVFNQPGHLVEQAFVDPRLPTQA